jgi:protein TonB
MASQKPSFDYYEILGLPRDASPDEIGVAFRSRVLAIRDQPGAGEETRRLNLAYRALSDPERRRDYDEALTGSREPLASAESEELAPPPPAAEAGELPPDSSIDLYTDPPRRSRGRTGPLLAAGIALLLLLLAGAWAGGLFRSDPEIAAINGDGGTAAPSSASEPAARRGGGLAGAIAELTGRKETADPGPLPAIPVETAAAPPLPSRPAERLIVNDSAGPVASGTENVVSPEVADDLGEAEGPATSAPANEPAVGPERQDPQPPSPEPVDQSSGPRLLRGGLYDSDNQGGRYQGTVGVRIAVGTDGRPQGCRVVRSSGNEGLDLTTCQLLQQRLFFSPARDRSGAPVRAVVESNHVWGSRRRR